MSSFRLGVGSVIAFGLPALLLVRGGRVQASALPAYRKLEDLVREPVARVYSGKVVRGASKEL